MEHSNNLSELTKALVAAQSEMKAAKRNAENPFFKSSYSTLESITETWKQYFSPHGLAFTHVPGFNKETFGIYAAILHTSGEWLRGFYPVITDKPGPQSLASAFSYARRYSLCGISGISSEDDDAESATERIQKHKTQVSTQAKTPAQNTETLKLSENQIKRLFAISKRCNWSHDDIKNYIGKLGIESTKDLNFMQYDSLVQNIEKFPKELR